MTSQQYDVSSDKRKTAKKYEIEYRQRQVAIMAAQGMTEIEIAAKVGVDNTTISKDIKALKLISQQFIYDITKSDFTFYYKQNLELVKLVLRKQWEIIEKDTLDSQDFARWRILSEFLGTVEILNGYYDSAKHMHKTPMERVNDEERFGIRPGTDVPKRSPEDELEELEGVQEEWQNDLKEYEKKQDIYHIEEAKEELQEIEEEIAELKDRIKQKNQRKHKSDHQTVL